MNSFPKVTAIVVTYNPELPILKNLLISTLNQVDNLIMVNNFYDAEVCEKIVELVNSLETNKITLFMTEENIGLASGLNYGIEKANKNESGYILLLDQDSIPDDLMVTKLLDAHDKIVAKSIKVAAVGPTHLDPRTGFTSSYIKKEIFEPYKSLSEYGIYITSYLQSSGSLIHLDSLNNILGFMNSKLFISHIDIDWCYRCRSLGYESFGVEDAQMLHYSGDDVLKIWIGFWRDIHTHSPFRNYYMARNTIWMLGKKYFPRSLKIYELLHICFILIFHAIFVPPRIQQCTSIFEGFIDGFKIINK